MTMVYFFSLLLPLLDNFLQFSRASSQSTNENFLQCFKNHTDPSDDVSQLIYSTSNSAYTSILQAYIRNLRFNTPKTRKPELIITPTRKSHVSAAIICTKNIGLRLKIRSGGHDFEGISYISDVPFVMLDMFNFRTINVEIDDKQTAYVEVGATVGELYYKIWEKSKLHGFPAGICPTVGIGGHISGGGYGNLLRGYGLSVDHVVDAELVDVNGRILDRKSMGEDLFWAIRGGGGASFGVVLSYTINLVPVPEIVSVFRVMRFAEDNVTNLIYKWQHIMQDIDKDLFIRLLLQPVTPKNNGQKVIRVTFISLFLGQADRLISVMDSGFPELGLQRSDCLEMSWGESVLFWGNFDNGTTMEVLLNRTYPSNYLKRKSDYVTESISKDGLDLLWKKLIELGKPGLVFNSYGGKMREIRDSETPFPHRSGILYKIQYSISWKEAGEDAEIKYLNLIRKLYDFMTPYVSMSPRSAYLNYRDLDIGINHNFTYEEGKVYGEKYFKGNFDTLVKVKSKVDPDNFFRNEQSIPILKPSAEQQRTVYVVYLINAFASWLACGKWFSLISW